MEYCFVAGNYPTKDRQVHVFLQNVVDRLADRGEVCNVVAPQSYVAYFLKKGIKRDIVAEYTTAKGSKYMVYSPLYAVLPKIRIGNFSILDWERRLFYRALKKVYKKNNFHADVIYSHFIQIGIAGCWLAKDLGLPSIIANGEADTLDALKKNSPKTIRKTLQDVTGILCVSSKNRSEVRTLCNDDPEVMKKVQIIVNAADSKRFYKKDRMEIRRRMGWPEDAFITAFTGSFIERKGVFRLCEAIDRIGGIHSIFMGVGEEKPNCKNILHAGRVNNTEMNDYLNAADVFVLPTQAEGCSNAIVEAVSAGLPVISSDREFNYDVLDDTCAILIDPDNVDEIEAALRKVKDDVAFRKQLEQGAQERAHQLSLEVRIDKIQRFVAEKMKSFRK